MGTGLSTDLPTINGYLNGIPKTSFSIYAALVLTTMSTTIKSGKLHVNTNPFNGAVVEEAQVNLLSSGLLEYKTANSFELIKLGPGSKAEISVAQPQYKFTVICSNTQKETAFSVTNTQDLEPWVNMINLARARQSAKLLHEHPLTEHPFPYRMPHACIGCPKNLILSFCEFCDEGKFQLCSDCHSSTKNMRSPFFKSKTHPHELMRFEKAMDPKFFPRAYNTSEFICSICNGTSNGPVYHCVECGEYDECSKCIGTVSAAPFAALGGLIGASLQGKKAEMTLNLNLLSGGFEKDPRPNAFKLMKDPKKFPIAASALANKHWDLTQIDKQPVNDAYFEVTFDKFETEVGIGIGNQIFVPNNYLGAQQNSFGYFNSGVIAKNGVHDFGNEVSKIQPGDTVGAGILYDSFNQRRVYFAHNGKKIDYMPSAITDFVHDGMDCFPGVSFAKDSEVVFTVNMTGPFKFNPSTIPNYRGDRLDRISRLPAEILTDVLAYAAVSPLQVAEMRRVSKRFSEMANNNAVWQKIFLARWPNQNRNLHLKSWMTLYKRRAAIEKTSAVPEPIHIENCNLEFTCPLLWENLKDTKTYGERFCDKCNKTVHEVNDLDTLKQYSQLGRCVSLRYIPPPPKPPMEDMWHMPLGGPPPPMNWNVPPIPPGPPPLMPPGPPIPPPPPM